MYICVYWCVCVCVSDIWACVCQMCDECVKYVYVLMCVYVMFFMCVCPVCNVCVFVMCATGGGVLAGLSPAMIMGSQRRSPS